MITALDWLGSMPIPVGILDTAGQYTEAVDLRHDKYGNVFTRFTYQVTLAGVGTNVLLQVVGNIDGSENYCNLSDDGADIHLTSDGTYLFQFDSIGDITHTRLYFKSESGGTASILTCLLKTME